MRRWILLAFSFLRERGWLDYASAAQEAVWSESYAQASAAFAAIAKFPELC